MPKNKFQAKMSIFGLNLISQSFGEFKKSVVILMVEVYIHHLGVFNFAEFKNKWTFCMSLLVLKMGIGSSWRATGILAASLMNGLVSSVLILEFKKSQALKTQLLLKKY